MFNWLFKSNFISFLVFWILTELVIMGIIFINEEYNLHTMVGWTLLSIPLSIVIKSFTGELTK